MVTLLIGKEQESPIQQLEVAEPDQWVHPHRELKEVQEVPEHEEPAERKERGEAEQDHECNKSTILERTS